MLCCAVICLQEEVYEESKPLIRSVLDGGSCCLWELGVAAGVLLTGQACNWALPF